MHDEDRGSMRVEMYAMMKGKGKGKPTWKPWGDKPWIPKGGGKDRGGNTQGGGKDKGGKGGKG